MSSILLKTIQKPDPGTMPIIENPNREQTFVMFRGIETFPDLRCGGCKAPLAVGYSPWEIRGNALLCNGCGACNTVP